MQTVKTLTAMGTVTHHNMIVTKMAANRYMLRRCYCKHGKRQLPSHPSATPPVQQTCKDLSSDPIAKKHNKQRGKSVGGVIIATTASNSSANRTASTGNANATGNDNGSVRSSAVDNGKHNGKEMPHSKQTN